MAEKIRFLQGITYRYRMFLNKGVLRGIKSRRNSRPCNKWHVQSPTGLTTVTSEKAPPTKHHVFIGPTNVCCVLTVGSYTRPSPCLKVLITWHRKQINIKDINVQRKNEEE